MINVQNTQVKPFAIDDYLLYVNGIQVAQSGDFEPVNRLLWHRGKRIKKAAKLLRRVK